VTEPQVLGQVLGLGLVLGQVLGQDSASAASD
jgi:hypothetical protein